MASKDQDSKPATKKAKEEAKAAAKERRSMISALVPILVVAIIAAILYFVYVNYLSTTFPTFLGNFKSASRVAVAITYGNITQYSEEAGCSQYIVQTIAHTRNASTIDFFIINATTCLYSPTGLGHAINISRVPASKCLNYARAEPSVFLNYSNTNNTYITPYHLYVSGNAAYMAKCGIAVDLG